MGKVQNGKFEGHRNEGCCGEREGSHKKGHRKKDVVERGTVLIKNGGSPGRTKINTKRTHVAKGERARTNALKHKLTASFAECPRSDVLHQHAAATKQRMQHFATSSS